MGSGGHPPAAGPAGRPGRARGGALALGSSARCERERALQDGASRGQGCGGGKPGLAGAAARAVAAGQRGGSAQGRARAWCRVRDRALGGRLVGEGVATSVRRRCREGGPLFGGILDRLAASTAVESEPFREQGGAGWKEKGLRPRGLVHRFVPRPALPYKGEWCSWPGRDFVDAKAWPL